MLALYSISILHCVIRSTLLAAYVRRGLILQALKYLGCDLRRCRTIRLNGEYGSILNGEAIDGKFGQVASEDDQTFVAPELRRPCKTSHADIRRDVTGKVAALQCLVSAGSTTILISRYIVERVLLTARI
jgi:hypothetical protein